MAERNPGDFRRRDRELAGFAAMIGHHVLAGRIVIHAFSTASVPPPTSRLYHATDNPALVARFPPMDGAVKKLIDKLPNRSILPAVTLAMHQRP